MVGITIQGLSAVLKNFDEYPKETQDKLKSVLEDSAGPELVEYARANKPWEDVTGAASEGINYEVIASTKEIALYLSHGVDYGVYLELAHEGRYAILERTLMAKKDDIIKEIQSALKEVFK